MARNPEADRLRRDLMREHFSGPIGFVSVFRADGMSYAKIAALLNTIPAYLPPAGGRWHAESVRRLVALGED